MVYDPSTPSRRPDEPEPGFYRSRLVPGGPFVACRIIRTPEGLWLLIRNGQPTSKIAYAEPWEVPHMEWVCFSPTITEAEYHALLASAEAALPGQPEADPMSAVNWRDADPVF